MSLRFENAIGSAPFLFVVGPDRKSYAVHTELVAHHSAPLGVLMKGSMREAQAGLAELNDVDDKTFVRFCEYVYIGDYTTAQYEYDAMCNPEPPSLKKNPVPAESSSFWQDNIPRRDYLEDDYEFRPNRRVRVTQPSIANTASGKQALLSDFQGLQYSVSITTFKPPKNVEVCEDYTNVFLCHARIYVFAERYDIANLRTLALYKLHQTLKNLKDPDKRTRDIVSLVQYTYNNENTRDNETRQEMDSLRKLVVHYVACIFEIMAKDESFSALMEEGGPFVRDLMAMLLKRMD